MATRNTEVFSVTHAAILDGATGLEESGGDVYGVREASFDVDKGEFDNTGDNKIMSTWKWFNKAKITVISGYVPFDLISLIYGSTISSSGSGDSQRFDLPLWELQGENVVERPFLVQAEAKDSAGVLRTFKFVFYKCQFEPIEFEGPVYKTGLSVSYIATALMSTTNEAGVALAYEAVGRMMAVAHE